MILVIVGTTVSLKSQVSANICLTPKEFDFYAKKYLECQSLKKDTALYIQKNDSLGVAIKEQQKELALDSLKFGVQSAQISIYSDKLDKAVGDYNKCKRGNRRLKSGLLMSLSALGLAVILIILKP